MLDYNSLHEKNLKCGRVRHLSTGHWAPRLVEPVSFCVLSPCASPVLWEPTHTPVQLKPLHACRPVLVDILLPHTCSVCSLFQEESSLPCEPWARSWVHGGGGSTSDLFPFSPLKLLKFPSPENKVMPGPWCLMSPSTSPALPDAGGPTLAPSKAGLL